MQIAGFTIRAFADEPQWVMELRETYGIPDFSFSAKNPVAEVIEPSDVNYYSFRHDENDVYNVFLSASTDYDFNSVASASGYSFSYESDGVIRSRVTQDLYSNEYGFYIGSLDPYKMNADYEDNSSRGEVNFKVYVSNGSEKVEIYSRTINFAVDAIYPHLTLKSVSQYGEQINPVWDEYLFKGADGSGDYGDYYYPVANNTDKVTIGVQVDGIPQDETWKVFYDQEITAEANGTIIYREMSPSVFMDDSYKCDPDNGGCWGYTYANEYHVEATLQKGDGQDGYSSTRVILRPEKVGSSDIEVLSVQQNGVDVYLDTVGRQEKNDHILQTINEYQLMDYSSPVTVRYKLKNLHEGWTYYSYAYSGSGSSDGSFVADSSEKIMTQEVYFSGTKKHDTIVITMSGNNYANGSQDSSSGSVWLYFRMADVNFVPVESLIIDEVIQGGAKVEPVYDENSHKYSFDLNDVQDVEVRLHAENAIDEATYYLTNELYSNYASSWSENKPVTISGNDLKNGTTISIKAKYGESSKSPFRLYAYIKANENASSRVNPDLYYENADHDLYHEFDFNFFKSDSVPRYETELAYANYSDIKINDSGAINPKYYNEENPLLVKIRGEYYDENLDYEININVRHAGESIYSKTTSKTGKELNNGSDIALDYFEMLLPDVVSENFIYAINQQTGYDFTIEINELSLTNLGVYYMYDGSLSSVIILDNGQVSSSSSGRGAAGPYVTSEGMSIAKALFNDGHTAIINYVGSEFDDENTYDYELYYSEGNGESYWKVEDAERIAYGTATGKELNDGRLKFELTLPSEGRDSVAYDLIIKKDGKLMQLVEDHLYFWEGAGISSFSLTADKNLYLQMNKTSYIVPEENDVKVKLKGSNFDETKEYTVSVGYNAYKMTMDEYGYHRSENVDLTDLNSEIAYTGAELNSGIEYLVKYDERTEGTDSLYIDFSVRDEEEFYPGHIVFLKYVDVGDIISSEKGYQVDNKTGRIRKISHSTSLDELNTALQISDGGSIKLFKSDGETEQDGNVGTGMIIRVVDEYDQPILDMEAVVTGDVTGTGTINSSDLLGIRRHLIGTAELDGAYYEAGNVVEDKSINSADLLRVRQHLIGINPIE